MSPTAAATLLDVEHHPTLVGLAEIAERLSVQRKTVDQWKWRGILPEPNWIISGNPLWEWADVEAWAKATDRL